MKIKTERIKFFRRNPPSAGSTEKNETQRKKFNFFMKTFQNSSEIRYSNNASEKSQQVIVITVPVAVFIQRAGRFSALYSTVHVPIGV